MNNKNDEDEEPVSIVHFVSEQYCKSRQKPSKCAPKNECSSSDGVRQEIQKVDDLYRDAKTKMYKNTSMKDLCKELKVSKKKSFTTYVDHVQKKEQIGRKSRSRSRSKCRKSSRDRSKSLCSEVEMFKEECGNIIDKLECIDNFIASQKSSRDRPKSRSRCGRGSRDSSRSRRGRRSRKRSESMSSEVDRFKEECESIIDNLECMVSDRSSCDSSEVLVKVKHKKKVRGNKSCLKVKPKCDKEVGTDESGEENLNMSICRVTENLDRIANCLQEEPSLSELKGSLSEECPSFQTFLKDQQMGCQVFRDGSNRVRYDMKDVVGEYEKKLRGKKNGKEKKRL